MKKLAPSILSADFSCLGEQVKIIEENGADLIHVDVMDGHFVPNISFGSIVTKCLKGRTGLPFDVHLMIEEPDRYLEDFVTEQTEYITVHIEVLDDPQKTIEHIRSTGARAGVSLNPETPLESVTGILDEVDMILVMSVHPGFGGQKFIAECLDKVRELARIREERGLDFEIEIDGGINIGNVREAADAGTDIIVAGSAVFRDDIAANTKAFLEAIR